MPYTNRQEWRIHYDQKIYKSSNGKDPNRYDELAAALVATTQVQAALNSVSSYDDLVGGDGLIARYVLLAKEEDMFIQS